MFRMLFVFFWVIPRRMIYICRRFGTLYLFNLQRQVPLKMEQIKCSETSAYINQTPGNHPKENKQQHLDCFALYTALGASLLWILEIRPSVLVQ